MANAFDAACLWRTLSTGNKCRLRLAGESVADDDSDFVAVMCVWLGVWQKWHGSSSQVPIGTRVSSIGRSGGPPRVFRVSITDDLQKEWLHAREKVHNTTHMLTVCAECIAVADAGALG